MPVQLVLDLFAPPAAPARDDRPGTASPRSSAPVPAGYAVFDCETTGTDTSRDEIVSLALLQLDPDGAETGRYT